MATHDRKLAMELDGRRARGERLSRHSGGPPRLLNPQRGRMRSLPGKPPWAATLLAVSVAVGLPAYGADYAEAPLPGIVKCKDDNATHELDKPLDEFLVEFGPNISVKTLIATVPDPDLTSFGAVFDAELASIRSAFTSMDYVSGQHFLPWRAAKPSTDDEQESPQKGDKRGKEGAANCCCPTADRPSSRCMPGILVFRRPATHGPSDGKQPVSKDKGKAGDQTIGPPWDFAFVLLVGETPLAGVFPRALEQALDFANKVRAEQEPISILGPTFSGSAVSLRRILERRRDAPPKTTLRPPTKFVIVSGSATSPDLRAAFACRKPGQDKCEDRPTFDFSATVVPDDVQTCAMYRFLEERLSIRMKNVALMTESNTTFGSYFFQSVVPGIKKKASPSQTDCDVTLRPGAVVPFPLHVSDLRSAADSRRRVSRDEASKARPIAFNRELELPLDQKQGDMDSLPAVAPEFTAAEVQLALADQLVTLCRQNIQALGILATDIRDVSVLGEEARRLCPRLLLFTLGPDRMLHHSRYHALDGMLVASTYPLHAAASQFTYPFRGRALIETFPSESAQGMFNATLLLMGDRSDSFRDYGSPGLGSWLGLVHRPPVWISVVGRDGFWPLHVEPVKKHAHLHLARTVDSDVAKQRGKDAWVRRLKLPNGFAPLLWLVLLFGVSNLIGFFRQSHPRSLPSRRRSVWSWLDVYRPVGLPFVPSRGLAVASGLFVLALMSAGVALLFAIPGFVANERLRGFQAIGATFVVGFLLAAASTSLCSSPVWTDKGINRRFLFVFVGIGLELGLVMSLWVPAIGEALAGWDPDLTLFFRRTTNIASGYSVALGALLYALTLFAAALSESGRIRMLDLAARFPSAFPLTASLDRVVRTGARGLLFVLAVTLVGTRLGRPAYYHPFEGRWMGYLFCEAGPYLIAGMILFQLFRFARTWATMQCAFHKYLEGHDPMPIRELVGPQLLRLLLPPFPATLAQPLLRHIEPPSKRPTAPPCQAVDVALLAGYGRAHLHNQLAFITGGGGMLIVMSTLYPFKLLHSIEVLTWVVVLAILLVVPVVLVAMNRSEVLSSIAGKTSGHPAPNGAFLRTLLVHVGLPLLGMAATRFPFAASMLGDIMDPLIRLFSAMDHS